MNILIKAHKTLYPVDIASLWYSPTSHRWHGQIVAVDGKQCWPFTIQTHGGPVDTDCFAALRDEFVLEDIDAADTCPFCGVEFGKHRLDVTCPCPPKACEHRNWRIDTKGCRRLIGGDVWDDIREVRTCADCGKELDSE